MRKIFFLFWICSYLITIRAEIKSISESLNQLTEGIDKLNRTYMSIDEKIEIIIVKRNEERLELKKSEINTLKDDLIIKKKNKIKESLKNELNLYFGFLLPKIALKFRRKLPFPIAKVIYGPNGLAISFCINLGL